MKPTRTDANIWMQFACRMAMIFAVGLALVCAAVMLRTWQA
ncbi:MAG: hypothetical protein NTU86_16750 [Burkholderiales bacterium]|nr:hypothetical protein [Burkholderiales bacterium]